MATKSLFGNMLNQKPISSPQVKAKGFKVEKPAGIKEFAYLGGSNPRGMNKFDPDIASSVWAKALKTRKGGNNV